MLNDLILENFIRVLRVFTYLGLADTGGSNVLELRKMLFYPLAPVFRQIKGKNPQAANLRLC
jgi:hypothetical protein